MNKYEFGYIDPVRGLTRLCVDANTAEDAERMAMPYVNPNVGLVYCKLSDTDVPIYSYRTFCRFYWPPNLADVIEDKSGRYIPEFNRHVVERDIYNTAEALRTQYPRGRGGIEVLNRLNWPSIRIPGSGLP